MIDMTNNSELAITKRALIHEQNRSEAMQERILELESELRTLQLKLAAKFAAEVDDN